MIREIKQKSNREGGEGERGKKQMGKKVVKNGIERVREREGVGGYRVRQTDRQTESE